MESAAAPPRNRVARLTHPGPGLLRLPARVYNPRRLAREIAWLDQLTKGRTFVGFARGYQTRWLNQMAQKIHVGATASDKSEGDRVNREAFEEVFRFLKLAWGDEPFRFKGKYYEYPSPQEGTPWPAREWTRGDGLPGQ